MLTQYLFLLITMATHAQTITQIMYDSCIYMLAIQTLLQYTQIFLLKEKDKTLKPPSKNNPH